MRQRNEIDFDTAVQRRRDAIQHGERVAFMVGVFQATDDRGGRPDELPKLYLGKTRLGADRVNLPHHGIVGAGSSILL